jgi:hypothetical protein
VARQPRTPALDRSPAERALAWVYTGPPGRLWSPLADIAVLWWRWLAGALRRRRGR